MTISITDNYSELKHVYLNFFMHSRIHLDRVIWKKAMQNNHKNVLPKRHVCGSRHQLEQQLK